MSKKEGQERICTQKLYPSLNNKMALNSIEQASNSTEYSKLSAAFYKEKLWEQDATIRVYFMQTEFYLPRTETFNTKNGPIDPLQEYFSNNLDANILDGIKRIVKERIQPLLSDLKIVFVDDAETSDVRVSFNLNGGCWSLLGTDALQETDKKQATMNFSWFDVATVVHEFCHMLGMIHEHQNPSGKAIEWDDNALFKWSLEVNGWDVDTTIKNIVKKYDRESITGSEFDPLSIMLYFFPANLTKNNKGTYQNLRLSGKDVLYITKMYGKEEDAPKLYQDMYGESIEKNIKKSDQYYKSSFGWILVALVIAVVSYSAWKKWQSSRR